MKRIIGCLLILATLFTSTALVGCSEEHEKVYYEFFDTVSLLYSYESESDEAFEEKCDAVKAVLGEYHKLLDIYYEYSGINNLCTVNKMAGKTPVKVDEKLIDFLEHGKKMYRLTDGKVNIAAGSVLRLWHNERERAEENENAARLPSAEALAEAAKHIDIDRIIINRKESTVFISDPKMSIDVGALGKGYATERAAQRLIEMGTKSFALNIGGNLRLIGSKNDKEDWSVGITNPDKTVSDFSARIKIRDTSCVTSGNYERYYTVEGVNYHHIIDLNTLYPSTHHASVSVITQDSGLGDCLSTALFCMTEEDGRALLDTLGTPVQVIWINSLGEVTTYGDITTY